MYKVFIVEDEIIVREGIRNSIPWDKTSYILAGEAPDGEMALSIIKDIMPDILITDIRMPFMDGLALSRIVKKTLPWIKIIILSGHDEFEYAREAISVGVEEYLLKPVSSQDMLQTLDKIACRIDAEKEELLNIEHLRQQAQSNSDTLRERWLKDFIKGNVPTADAIEKARELGIDLIAHSYTTAVISASTSRDNHSQSIAVKLIIRSITEKYSNVILFQGEENKHIMLIKGMPGEKTESDSLEESVYTIAQAVKHEVERNTECKIAVGIGGVVNRLGEVSKSYFKADRIVNNETAVGLWQISDGDPLQTAEGKDRLFDQTGLLNFGGDILWAKFRYASKKDIDSIINEYTGLLQDSAGEGPILEYFMLGEIIVAASKIIEEFNGDINTIIPFSLNKYELKEIINSRETFNEKIRALFTAVIEFRDSRMEGRYQSVILKAREFIDQHYGDQDISLHTVAFHVGISPNHLSTVFSQDTGENFIEYLTRVRIDKAKQLLENTAMKNADIAGKTGFSDPHYFSFIFKKNTGLSPREYRNSKAKGKT
ncbi:MAG: response regulator [Treponema sp.]|jgi:two-component system response regulator YesN|nr:response regulator [Treponema sp.]